MGVWLIQTGQSRAHLYPDDEDGLIALCGAELEDVCEHCGRSLETANRPYADKCQVCLNIQERTAELPTDRQVKT